jgi:AraC-like DNA-binding protein
VPKLVCSPAADGDDDAESLSDSHFSLWRSPYVDGLDIVESCEHQGCYPLHLHEAMEIIWMQQGSGAIECRGRQHFLQAGEACVVSPYEFHGGGAALSSGPIKFCLIHVPQTVITPGFLSQYFRAHDSGASLPLKSIPRGSADCLLSGLLESLLSDRSSEQHLQSIASGLDALLVLECKRRSSTQSCQARHPAIEHVKLIIGHHYAEPLNVGALASEVELNERYLISLFRLATGIPPHQFQIAVRVDRSRRLLPSGMPLSTIAASVGFADQSHLNRHFKRQYGFTPGVFRRLLLPI